MFFLFFIVCLFVLRIFSFHREECFPRVTHILFKFSLHVVPQSQGSCHVQILLLPKLSIQSFHSSFITRFFNPFGLRKFLFLFNGFTILLVLRMIPPLAFSVLIFRKLNKSLLLPGSSFILGRRCVRFCRS